MMEFLSQIDPWLVVGWIVLCLMLVIGILFTVFFLTKLGRRLLVLGDNVRRYLNTRNMLLEEGQHWRNHYDDWYILERVDLWNDRLLVRSRSVSWGESVSTFKQRIRKKLLFIDPVRNEV